MEVFFLARILVHTKSVNITLVCWCVYKAKNVSLFCQHEAKCRWWEYKLKIVGQLKKLTDTSEDTSYSDKALSNRHLQIFPFSYQMCVLPLVNKMMLLTIPFSKLPNMCKYTMCLTQLGVFERVFPLSPNVQVIFPKNKKRATSILKYYLFGSGLCRVLTLVLFCLKFDQNKSTLFLLCNNLKSGSCLGNTLSCLCVVMLCV